MWNSHYCESNNFLLITELDFLKLYIKNIIWNAVYTIFTRKPNMVTKIFCKCREAIIYAKNMLICYKNLFCNGARGESLQVFFHGSEWTGNKYKVPISLQWNKKSKGWEEEKKPSTFPGSAFIINVSWLFSQCSFIYYLLQNMAEKVLFSLSFKNQTLKRQSNTE